MNLKKLKKIIDASDGRLRQLQRSLEVWEQRLADNPNDKKIQSMVEKRRQEVENYQKAVENPKQVVAELTEEVPSIKNAQDLYNYAEKLGIQYKGVGGKPLGSDVIKGEIAKVLWDRQHPGEEMPPQISPMLIKDITGEGKEYVDREFTKDKYVLQQKINGQRFILTLNPDGSTHMTSRDRSVKTFRYSELDDHVLGLLNLKSPFKGRVILDGEILCDNPEVTLPSGVKTTSTLQSTVALMHMNSKDSLKFQEKYGSLRYKVFDIIMLDGKSVEDEPYDVRKELTVTTCEKIKELNPHCSIDILPTIEDYESAWDEFEKYVSEGGEGLIVKSRTGKYEQGKRTKGQWKLKGRLTIDAFITGFVPASEDKSLKAYIGGFTFSTNYHGKIVEIAAVSNIDMQTRKEATSYDKYGKPTLNPKWLGRCAELVCQNLKRGSFRAGSARISEWRDDKQPSDCELQDEMIRFDE